MNDRFDNDGREDLFSGRQDDSNQNEFDYFDLNSFSSKDEDVKTYSPSNKSSEPRATSSSSNGKTFKKRKTEKAPVKSNGKLVNNKMKVPEDNRSTGRKIAGKVGKVVLSLFLIMVITGCIVAGAFVVYVFTCVDDSIEFNLNDYKQNNASVIYVKDKDYDGTPDMTTGEGWKVYQSLSNEKRTWVSLDDVSMNVINAYVAGEDQTFFEHEGVNWKRTFGAFVNLVIPIYDSEQGGSTITQQLIKNITKDDDHSAMRKIREIMRARELEKLYSKETIMECYLNEIYLGYNCYGIEAAANYYFDKTSSELSIAEGAAIAAITKAPTYYNPVDYPEDNKDRRNWILRQEYEIGKISKEEYEKACKEELDLVCGDTGDDNKSKDVYSYFTDAVIEDVIADLIDEYGYAYSYAENIVLNGGLKIYSTCDTGVQKIMEEEYMDDENFSIVYNTDRVPQSAMTVMDYSGHVVGIVGGRGEKTESRTLNRAWSSPRQPGSTMKPMGVYALAIEENAVTYSTKISNSALSFGGMSYKNYGGNTTGPVTVQHAVEVSYNLPPIRILRNDLGYHNSFTFCKEKLGLDHLVEGSDENPNLAVGGLTYGVTTTEEAGAYAIFGNGGKFYRPTTYYQVLDSKDEVLLNYDAEPIQAISEESATIMNRILRTVVTGSSATASGAYIDGYSVFAKTGTTSDEKDRWFAGGTPHYVASVWFGCDKPTPMYSLSSGTNPALRLWRAAMRRIHSELDLEDKSFEMGGSVRTATYCSLSGKIKGEKCEAGGTGYYKSSYMPVCDGKDDHIIADVDEKDSSVDSSSEESNGSSSNISGDESNASGTSSTTASVIISNPTSSDATTSVPDVSSEPVSSETPSLPPEPSSVAPPVSELPPVEPAA